VVDVLAVSMVEAAAPLTLTVDGLNEQLIPVGARHWNVTAPVNPSVGVTVSIKLADCPAVMVML
jgi:hypothetical protein